MFCENMDKFTEALKRKGYIVHIAANGAEARKEALEICGGSSVGFGGSVTVDSLGIYEALAENGNVVYWHWKANANERAEITKKITSADCYISSTNAITRDGVLVNTDGTGNRVAGMIGAGKTIIIIAGKNKLVDTVNDGIERIKSVAAQLNCKRLNLKTPCAVTGKCHNCSSEQRICRVTTLIDCPPRQVKAFHIVLVDEELGY